MAPGAKSSGHVTQGEDGIALKKGAPQGATETRTDTLNKLLNGF
jgi:hypothetical protein